MKTTLELDDALLIEAKSVAAKRRTTLKALVEHALRRELAPASDDRNPDPEKFEIGPLGLPVLKRRPEASRTTLEDLRGLEEEMTAKELQRAVELRGA